MTQPTQKDFVSAGQMIGLDPLIIAGAWPIWKRGEVRGIKEWNQITDVFKSWPEVFGKPDVEGIVVLVCGGRKFKDSDFVNQRLDWVNKNYGPIKHIVHGGATGADTRALEWAISRGIKHRPYRPDWKANGRAAGPIRNSHMLKMEKPDIVVAFPGGPGTYDMVRKAEKTKVTIFDFKPESVK